jgi:hypothetical protein
MQQDKTIVLTTPDEIAYGQLAILKGALKLEKVGMKTRGGALRPVWAAKLGLKPRDSYDTFIAEVQKRMDKMLDEQERRAKDLK